MAARAIKSLGKCIVPGCKNPEKWRGQCVNCYFDARDRILSGEITEEELLKRKLIKPSRRGRKANNALSKILGPSK